MATTTASGLQKAAYFVGIIGIAHCNDWCGPWLICLPMYIGKKYYPKYQTDSLGIVLKDPVL